MFFLFMNQGLGKQYMFQSLPSSSLLQDLPKSVLPLLHNVILVEKVCLAPSTCAFHFTFPLRLSCFIVAQLIILLFSHKIKIISQLLVSYLISFSCCPCFKVGSTLDWACEWMAEGKAQKRVLFDTGQRKRKVSMLILRCLNKAIKGIRELGVIC